MSFPTYGDDRVSLERGETTCRDLVLSFLERIEHENEHLNAFLSVDREGALRRADELDRSRAEGAMRPLHGMVVAVKDMICQRGRVVSCGSRMLEEFESLYSATAVERLEEAGAIIIGRTNCDEFGMGSSNENSYFGPARNPHSRDRVPGGSSGGSAAAVAAGLCHTALGTDTGGSVRQPASFCGVAGLKPTYGRISRYGLVAYASSFDVIGPLGRSVGDLALMLQVMAGHDPRDSTSAPVDVPDYRLRENGAAGELRVGIPDEFVSSGLTPEVEEAFSAAVDRLKENGATVREVSLPHTRFGIAAYYVLTTAEASSNLARYDGVRYGYRANVGSAPKDGRSPLERLYTRSRSEGFGDEVKRRIMLGTYVLSSGYYDAYYAKAQRVRTLIRRDFDAAFSEVDVLLTPATPSAAFELGAKSDDPLEMYLSDIFTVTASLAGIPGLVVPAPGDSRPLPVGVQLLGRHFDESLLLRIGDTLMKKGMPA